MMPLLLRSCNIASTCLIVVMLMSGYANETSKESYSQLPRTENIRSKAAMSFLDEVNTRENCSNLKYIIVPMGCGGGFAAHLQLAAIDYLRALASYNYTIPVIIRGKINGYSEGNDCSHVNNEWTCFFEPLSLCEKELMLTGNQVNPLPIRDNPESLIPPQFLEYGLAFWWGIIQARVFRINSNVTQYVLSQARNMQHGGFPFGANLTGIHVRHGDKKSDGFREHSFEAEIQVAKKSPHFFNNSEMKIFVATDDIKVLKFASDAGYYVTSVGLSHGTGTTGMFQTVRQNHELGYNASLEIISDIYFLSHCNTLVGIAASQIYRMAVGISNATGILKYAVALDHSQFPRIQQMSAKYGLLVPEKFEIA